jgi:hypothetical protein
MKINKHTHNFEDSNELFREGRAILRGTFEQLPENVRQSIDQELRSAGVPDAQIGDWRNRMAGVFSRGAESAGGRESAGSGGEAPELTGLSEDRRTANKQIEKTRQQVEVRDRTKDIERKVASESGPIAKKAVTTGAIAGSTAFIPSYLASLGSVSASVAGLATGGAGAMAGSALNRNLVSRGFKDRPVALPAVGASIGVASVPALKSACLAAGPNLASAGGGAITMIAGLFAAIPGYWLGYNLARKKWIFAQNTWAGKERGMMAGVTTGIAGAGLSYMAAGGLVSMFGSKLGITASVNALGGAVTGLGNVLPAAAGVSVTSGLLPASMLALLTAGGAAGLYALGSKYGAKQGWNKTGKVGNIGRGLIALPHAGYRFGKFLAMNKVTKTLTSPAWGTVRGAFRLTKGLVEGLSDGIAKRKFKEESRNTKGVGWLTRAPTYAASRIIRSPLDISMGLWDGIKNKDSKGIFRSASHKAVTASKAFAKSPYTISKWLLSPWGK